jgi:BASS family bile acid:Na+ symporter
MLEVGVQNAAVAVGLALSLLSLEHAVPAIVYSLLVYVTAAIVILVSR